MKVAPVTALPRALCALILSAALLGAAVPSFAAEKPRAKKAAQDPAAAESAAAKAAADRRRAQAVREVLRLQARIDEERDTVSALDGRTQGMNRQLFAQRTKLSDARSDLQLAKGRYRREMVSMYKSGGLGPIELIVGSTSMHDLLRRATLISRMARSARDAVAEARRREAEAAYLAAAMDEMKTQVEEMAKERKARLASLEKDLAAQQAIISGLDPVGRTRATASLRRRRSARVARREEWRKSSVPLSSPVWLAHAIVSPHSEDYLVPSHQPRKYKSAGSRYTAVCSWYGNEFHGRRTASGQIFNQNDFTCASRTLPFGTRLALSRGSRHIIVVVNDRGPFVHGRDLDLSRAAAFALGFSGVASVTAEKVVAQ